MSVIISLYPPVIDTYQPAQIEGESLRVYFSLSDYNTFSEMKDFAQVTISDQESNLSVLDKTKYPAQIMLKTIGVDNTRTVDKYYVDIAATDGNFDIDKFYKVQIRFTLDDEQVTPVSLDTPQAIDAWLSENLDYFSEWSRVTLIKWISSNSLYINGTEMSTDNTSPSSINLSIANQYLTGELIFETVGKEYLNSYRIYLKDNSNNLLVDSGNLFTDKTAISQDTFDYIIKYALTASNTYKLEIDYETNSLYSAKTYATITATGSTGSDQGFTFSAKENFEDGDITLRISRNSGSSYSGKLAIKRSSDDSNFTIWEDMYSENLTIASDESFLFDWVDKTIESGKLYKYALLETYTYQSATVSYLKNYEKVLMLVLDDMYLTIKDKQLNIKFNPQVSSFKRIVNEGKIETIGSPYPYIRRNAAINYAQFPISGLISCQMDENGNFISKEDLYGGHDLLKKYEKFNTREEYQPFITTIDNDFVYERKFRDAVMKFLMDGQVKLFRSSTEGNFLIRLTDITFTPNQQLGRMVWTFSATANEIADNTVDNYKKYKIL